MAEKHEFTINMKVEEACTASYIGSGELPILATPALAALAENASMIAYNPVLGDTETTVGGRLEILHKLPTCMGKTVTITSVLTRKVGRKLHFVFTASCDGKVIAEGRHVRHVVDKRKFMEKAKGL